MMCCIKEIKSYLIYFS